MPPIHLTTTFHQTRPGNPVGKHDYTRAGNPNRDLWESVVADLEAAKHGIAFASGMATISALLGLLKPGSHVVCTDACYGGTYRFLTRMAAVNQGVETDFVDTGDPEKIKEVLRENTRMIFVETPTNPLLTLTDLAAVATLARERGITTVVDNTFLSSYYQRPLELGIDLVFHSSTKYLGGHSDVLGGIALTRNDDIAEKLRFMQFAAGAVPAPFDCWLLMRSVKTLAVRMRQHNENAMRVAQYLQIHPRVKKVFYPGLQDHVRHEVAVAQQRDPAGNPGFGGMVSFYLQDEAALDRFFQRIRVFALAESLGGIESLVNHPYNMTHHSVPVEPREKMGITANLARLSVGIEDIDDLLADLETALA